MAWARVCVVDEVLVCFSSLSHSHPLTPSPSPPLPLPLLPNARATASLSYSLSRSPELRSHFPALPILPAVYSVEAVCRVAAALVATYSPRGSEFVRQWEEKEAGVWEGRVPVDEGFVSWVDMCLRYPRVRNARFLSPITPERQCEIVVSVASVNGERALCDDERIGCESRWEEESELKRGRGGEGVKESDLRRYAMQGHIHDVRDNAVAVKVDFDMVLGGHGESDREGNEDTTEGTQFH